MRSLFLATITLLSLSAGYKRDTGTENNYQKPRLPLMLEFINMPYPVQSIFRQQLAEKGMDTVGMEQGIKLIIGELSERMETAKRNNSTFRATPPQPKCFMVWFGIEMNELSHINRIYWKAYAMPNNDLDTSRKYYQVPDSLQTDARKSISGCIDAMIKARTFR